MEYNYEDLSKDVEFMNKILAKRPMSKIELLKKFPITFIKDKTSYSTFYMLQSYKSVDEKLILTTRGRNGLVYNVKAGKSKDE